MGATTRPISTPYLMTVSPFASGFNGQLMSDGNLADRLVSDDPVLIHNPSGEPVTGLHAFNDDNPYRIVLVVHHKVNVHACLREK